MAEREMTGIEALEELINMIPKEEHINSIHNTKIDILKYNVLKFLDKLEQLEKENRELRKAVKSWNENGGKLIKQNTKLKQALEKACERLDDDCPVSQELIDDLDCEECESNCKECWVKYFLKQVFESAGDSDD